MSDGDEWVRELEGLQQRGEQLQRSAAKSGQEVLSLLAIPEHGAVAIEFDAKGLMVALTFDPELRSGLAPDQLVQELNLAVIRSSTLLNPTAMIDSNDSALIERASRQLTASTLPQPEAYSNDFHTVTVTAMWGLVVSIECSRDWIASTSDAGISKEIVRMARSAALATDALGRFS